MKQHAVPWWLTTEDLPSAANRVTLENATPGEMTGSLPAPTPSPHGAHPSGDTDPKAAFNQTGSVTVAQPGRIKLSYTPNNIKSFERLKDRWVETLKAAGHATTSVPLHAYFKKRIPIATRTARAVWGQTRPLQS